MQDYQKHDEYDNRLNGGGKDAPKGLPPRALGAPNARSMKNLELNSRGSVNHNGPNSYGNKINIVSKPVRASQNFVPNPDPHMAAYANLNHNSATMPLSPNDEERLNGPAHRNQRNLPRGSSNRSTTSNRGVDSLEQKI